jgi:t-SNARE complex subunit (syntaxin)|tara:strand:- start:2440 stop:2622 length:183 start_codon:yes stop_codon:yes gene_type:complete
MQFNYNSRFRSRASTKKKIFYFFLYVLAFLFVLFVLSKFNFPSPKQEIKKNITNEIIKLK